MNNLRKLLLFTWVANDRSGDNKCATRLSFKNSYNEHVNEVRLVHQFSSVERDNPIR
jgi:hypothetical protein